MRAFFNIALPFILLLSLSSFYTPDYRFTGKWRGTFKGEIGTITFDEESIVTVNLRGKNFGGRNYKIKGRLTNATYEINDSSDPKEIDVVLRTIDDNQEIFRIRAIYDFMGSDKLKVCINLSGSQLPSGFGPDNSQNQVILEKIE